MLNYTLTQSHSEILPLKESIHNLSDHNALKWIRNLACSTGRMARWRLRLSLPLWLQCSTQGGMEIQAADALLRLDTERADKTPLEDDIAELVVSFVHHRDPSMRNKTAVRPANIAKVKPATSLVVRAESFNRSMLVRTSKCYTYSNGRSSNFERVPWRTQCRGQTPSCCTDGCTSRLLLLVWLWRHAHKDSTNQQQRSKFVSVTSCATIL